MKKKIFLMSLFLPLFLAGCIEESNEPNEPNYSTPNLANIDDYYLLVGDDEPMKYTMLKFEKEFPENPESTYFIIEAEGRNDKHKFKFVIAMKSDDSQMLSEGWYGGGGYGGDYLDITYFDMFIFDLSINEMIRTKNNDGCACYVVKVGENFVCELRSRLLGLPFEVGNVIREPVITVFTLNKQFMNGEVYTADY